MPSEANLGPSTIGKGFETEHEARAYAQESSVETWSTDPTRVA